MTPVAFPHAAAEFMLVVLCGVGLATTWLARVSQGSAAQVRFQWLFLACLALVFAATALAVHMMPGCWFAVSGATCALMIVASVYDPGLQPERG